MGFSSLFRALPGTIFNVFGDAHEVVTYRYQAGGSTYDNATMSVARDPLELPVRAVFDSYSLRERQDSAIKPNDRKCTISGAELARVSPIPFSPTVHDTILRPDGTEWTVVSVETDVYVAAWVLQVRRP